MAFTEPHDLPLWVRPLQVERDGFGRDDEAAFTLTIGAGGELLHQAQAHDGAVRCADARLRREGDLGEKVFQGSHLDNLGLCLLHLLSPSQQT